MNGGDGGWDRGGADDSTWGGWNSPRDPETSEFEGIAWSDTAAPDADPGGWYGDGGGSGWTQPTEAAVRRRRWPIVVAAVSGVLAVAAAGAVGWRLAEREGGPEPVQAIATTVPELSTATSVQTSTPSEPQVRPAQGRPTASACTREEIGRDIGSAVGYVDCFGDWALAVTNAHGNVVRLVNGAWTTTRYGASSCTGPEGRAEIPRALFAKHLTDCSSARSSSSRSRASTTPRSSTARAVVPSVPPPANAPAPEAPPPPPPPPPPPVEVDPAPSEAPVPTSEATTAAPTPAVTSAASAPAGERADQGE